MLPGMKPNQSGANTRTLLEMLTDEGLLTSLDLCLDAGDEGCFGHSTFQTWSDVSGNGHHFYRGTSASVQSTDPSFVGTPGGRSAAEYFSFDGGDFFTETADHGFDTEWHKDNAAFTIIAAIYPGSIGDNNTIYASAKNTLSSAQGVFFMFDTGGNLNILIHNATSQIINVENTVALNGAAWNFAAATLDEATGANGVTLQTNATQEQFTSTYASPSSSDPSLDSTIGSTTDNAIFLASGSRLGCIAAWSRRLTDAELTALYTVLQTRYPF